MSARTSPAAQAQLQPMAIAVQGDGVAGGRDLGDQRRAPLHLLADHEERRARVRAREGLEHGRRALGVRAVVERQRDARGRRC